MATFGEGRPCAWKRLLGCAARGGGMGNDGAKGVRLAGGHVVVRLSEDGAVILQIRESPEDVEPLNIHLPPHAAERLGRALLEAAADGERLQRYRLSKGRA